MITILDRADGRTWSVTLHVVVDRMPTAMRKAVPAKGVANPYRVTAHKHGSDTPEFFEEIASEAEALARFREQVLKRKRLQPTG